MATINCAVTKGDTPISISWLFNGEPVQSGYNSLLVTKSGQRISMLAIESVRSEHAGVYLCIARNRAGEAQHSSQLKVIGTQNSLHLLSFPCTPDVPLINPFEFGEEPFYSSSTVSVQCVITKGDTPIEIVWSFNNRSIDTNDGIVISKMGQKMSTLYIESIRSRHAGVYSCNAKNKAGSVQHSSELRVIGNDQWVVFCCFPFPINPKCFPSFCPSISAWKRLTVEVQRRIAVS